MTTFTYSEGSGDGTMYGNGHHTQTLFVTNEDTGETRKYTGWTYMDCEEEEELQEILQAIWEQDENMGYGADVMPYTIVK